MEGSKAEALIDKSEEIRIYTKERQQTTTAKQRRKLKQQETKTKKRRTKATAYTASLPFTSTHKEDETPAKGIKQKQWREDSMRP